MKLKGMLREHFTYKENNTVWVPKATFASLKEIEIKTGFNLNECNPYICSYCKKFHVATYRNKSKTKVKR